MALVDVSDIPPPHTLERVEPPPLYALTYSNAAKLAEGYKVLMEWQGRMLLVALDENDNLIAYNFGDNATNIQNKRNYEEVLSSSGSSSHKHCISINRIYDLLHRCGLWRSGHHVP
jgi:hypothetical protein